MDELKVGDVMTHLVVTLRPEESVPLAAQMLVSNRISGAPVVRGGRLVGVVSEADLVRAYAPPIRRGAPFVATHPLLFILLRETPRSEVKGVTVQDVMTSNVISIGPDESVWEAASLIDRHGVRRLPVVDDEGYVIGVVSRSDLVRAMARSQELRARAS